MSRFFPNGVKKGAQLYNNIVRTPTGVNDVFAWFDAQEGVDVDVSGNVNRWHSKTNGFYVEQSESAHMPIYNLNVEGLNGKHSIGYEPTPGPHGKYLYARTNDTNQELVEFVSGSSAYTMFLVSLQPSSATNTGSLISWGTADSSENIEVGVLTNDDVMLFTRRNANGNSPSSLYTSGSVRDDEYHIHSFKIYSVLDGNIWMLRQDGKTHSAKQFAAPPVQEGTNEFWLGGRQSSGSAPHHSLAEFIIYDRELTDKEIDTVEDYLFDKYFKPDNFSNIVAYFKANDLDKIDLEQT